MKMYTKTGPKQLKERLEKVDMRAKSLGYKKGNYVSQLFVTGACESNVEKYINTWPPNCMVFATESLKLLYQPFGSGIIAEIVKLKCREK